MLVGFISDPVMETIEESCHLDETTFVKLCYHGNAAELWAERLGRSSNKEFRRDKEDFSE